MMKREAAKTTSSRSSRGNEALNPNGWQTVKLYEICCQDRQIIEQTSEEAASRPYLSLEHIESNTGRILRPSSERIPEEGKSTTFVFDARHVLYGKLRPYLNKVALPDFAGRCTTELIPLLPNESIVSRDFLAFVLRRKETVAAAMQGKTGSRMPRANMDALLRLSVPLPALAEQRRIAGRLREQLAAVAQAHAAVQAQLDAAQVLPAAHLRTVFNSPAAQRWPRRRLDELCDLLPSKAIALSGDTEVRAITSACLSETGFKPEGVKTARMWAAAARESIVSRGEILIARSNTPELVGRVSIYGGEPKGVVASDLTVRLWPGDQSVGSFLASYLSFLFVSGYWKDRAGGASGTMKKITRTQIEAEQVPAPSFAEQQLVADRLEAEVAATVGVKNMLQDRLTALDHLPAALLREAFNGKSA